MREGVGGGGGRRGDDGGRRQEMSGDLWGPRACSDAHDLQFGCNKVVSSVVVESKIEKN